MNKVLWWLKDNAVLVILIVAILSVAAGMYFSSQYKYEVIFENQNKLLEVARGRTQTDLKPIVENTAFKKKQEQEVIQDEITRPTIADLKENEGLLQEVKENVVAEVEIPNIDLNVPILQGTTAENLMYGATTYFENQKAGEGNYVLLSHNVKENSNILFSNLNQVTKGMVIYVKEAGETYKYKVTGTEVVKNTEGAKVFKESEKPILTLITCEIAYKTPNRFIVYAEYFE
ncbi:class A sortase [Enterococcus sp. LJL128]